MECLVDKIIKVKSNPLTCKLNLEINFSTEGKIDVNIRL